MNKKQFIGIGIFVVLIIIIIVIKAVDSSPKNKDDIKGLTTVYVATGGGKEDFLAEKNINLMLYLIHGVMEKQ